MLNLVMFNKKYSSPFEVGKITQEKIKVQNIKLGSKLVVAPNQMAYIIYKGKPYDKFIEGEFELQGGVMPKIFKTSKLDTPKKARVSKKLVYPTSFKGSIVFINKQLYHNFDYKTGNILLFDRIDDFKFRLKGTYDFEIVDFDIFAKFVAKQGKSNNYVIAKLNKYVSKKIRYEFHKEEYEIENFLFKNNDVFSKIITKLNKRLQKIGIEIKSATIDEFLVNKKYQARINDYISGGQIKIHYSNLGEENVISQQCNQDF